MSIREDLKNCESNWASLFCLSSQMYDGFLGDVDEEYCGTCKPFNLERLYQHSKSKTKPISFCLFHFAIVVFIDIVSEGFSQRNST